MTHGFDAQYWESHWRQARERDSEDEVPANPYLARETRGLLPGTALDAGCGEGAEAIWLAAAGWKVTAADISREALARARERAAGQPTPEPVEWVEADLSRWEPGRRFDLVTTHYAHPAMPQLAFYERLRGWVAPGGTLLIVGHLHTAGSGGAGHDHGRPPAQASVTASDIAARLDPGEWEVATADEQVRTLGSRAGRAVTLNDVIVRAARRA